MSQVRTILFPSDYSECSRTAFAIAQALARDYHARLLVLHVATPPPLVTYRELQRALEQPNGYRRELADMLRSLHPADAAAGVEYRVEDGEPAAEIMRVAEEVRCDLIVMGTHGRTGLGRMLLGSVAEQVVRNAVCPVLTVKAPLPSTNARVAPDPAQAEECAIVRIRSAERLPAGSAVQPG
jgi:nucleotide-binding universal stress UspA family protein